VLETTSNTSEESIYPNIWNNTQKRKCRLLQQLRVSKTQEDTWTVHLWIADIWGWDFNPPFIFGGKTNTKPLLVGCNVGWVVIGEERERFALQSATLSKPQLYHHVGRRLGASSSSQRPSKPTH